MSGRTPYTKSDEDYLSQYIAKYNPQPEGRSGNALYQRLVENKDGKWNWSRRHTWQSWRNHYVTNRARMDKKIARHVKPGRKPDSTAPRISQLATPRHSQTTPGSQRKRVPFTREDDQNIIDFLANASPALGATKGQKLWMTLEEDPHKYPWAEKRGWQSWRERYIKHDAYFDWAVKKRLRGDGDDESEDEPDIPPPRTVEDYRVRKRPSQAASSAHADNLSPEKRKRISDAARDAPPKKKKRVQVVPSDEDKQPEAGPSRRHDDESGQDADEAAADEDEGGLEAADEDEVAQEVDERGSIEDEDNDQEDEEDRGSVGSNDYHGQIFDSHNGYEDEVDEPEGRAASDSSGRERDELFHMLTDDPRAETHYDDEMEVDMTADQTMVETSGNMHDDTGDASQEVGPPGNQAQHVVARSSPPARKHQPRIKRELDQVLSTPPLSPTDEAQARHHLEHDHSPAPARKHVPRIRRPADEFFGTPQPSSQSGTVASSPTSRHLAHARKDDRAKAEDEDTESVKHRAPPRLEEGPWTKAFSDVHGKSRVSGTGRRKSGVDFEDEAQIIGVQDTPVSPDGQDDDGEEAPETTPMQWPPNRRKDKTGAPSTPVAGRSAKDKGKARADAPMDSTVRTEKTVSVKTVRTVERRIPRVSNGTPYVRGLLAAAVEDEDETDAELEASQHHPFSQPVFAPAMAASTSSHSNVSNPAVPKADVSRLQKLLSGHLRVAPQPSPSKAERDIRPPANARPRVLGPGAARVHAVPSRETMSPPGAIRDDDGERFNEFEEKDEELPGPIPAVSPSPLVDRAQARSRVYEDFLSRASSSRIPTMNITSYVDEGKTQAARTSHAMGHKRRHTLAGPDVRDALPGPSNELPLGADRPMRRSVPPGFSIGDDLPPTAFSLLFNPPRSGSAHPRSYSLAHPPRSGSSRSISPYMSADVAAAKRLPSNELDLVLEIGISQVFRIMAENHGFGEPTVRDAFAATGSLEQTDRLLCKMRESANKAANEVLSARDEEDEERDDGDDVDMDQDGDEDEGEPDQDANEFAGEDDTYVAVEEDHPNYRRSAQNDEQEVEHVLDYDTWMQDGAPLAESSRFDVIHSRRGSSFGPDSRKRKSLVIKRVSPEPPSPAEYSPPKRTRAGKHVARQSLSKAHYPMNMDSATGANGGSPDIGHERPSNVGLGQLARYSTDQWRRLGPGGAKIATGRALAKLLQ